jgi:uncharacterized protein (TIGR00730 family)
MSHRNRENSQGSQFDKYGMPVNPRPVFDDFRKQQSWRALRILAEFVEGFEFLAPLRNEVTIFGSARVPEGDEHYEEARKLGKLLARGGYTVVTGGGPGIMEAANRGATEGGGPSVGLNIELPHEQRTNPYVKSSHAFHYFFTRKVMLSASAQAYIYFPGGFGTLDEMFEIVTLIQTHKTIRIPLVLVGRDYWDGLISWLKQNLLVNHQYIAPEDLNIMKVVDTAEEAFKIVKTSKPRSYF